MDFALRCQCCVTGVGLVEEAVRVHTLIQCSVIEEFVLINIRQNAFGLPSCVFRLQYEGGVDGCEEVRKEFACCVEAAVRGQVRWRGVNTKHAVFKLFTARCGFWCRTQICSCDWENVIERLTFVLYVGFEINVEIRLIFLKNSGRNFIFRKCQNIDWVLFNIRKRIDISLGFQRSCSIYIFIFGEIPIFRWAKWPSSYQSDTFKGGGMDHMHSCCHRCSACKARNGDVSRISAQWRHGIFQRTSS